jgi:hypothetical protein
MFDYREAAARHARDAKFLREHDRLENAGQLFGMHAECALKALLVAHGLKTTPEGDIDRSAKEYRKHIDVLHSLVSSMSIFPDGRSAADIVPYMENLSDFASWNIEHRYKKSEIPLNDMSKWAQASHDLEQMIDHAVMQGIMA